MATGRCELAGELNHVSPGCSWRSQVRRLGRLSYHIAGQNNNSPPLHYLPTLRTQQPQKWTLFLGRASLVSRYREDHPLLDHQGFRNHSIEVEACVNRESFGCFTLCSCLYYVYCRYFPPLVGGALESGAFTASRNR